MDIAESMLRLKAQIERSKKLRAEFQHDRREFRTVMAWYINESWQRLGRDDSQVQVGGVEAGDELPPDT